MSRIRTDYIGAPLAIGDFVVRTAKSGNTPVLRKAVITDINDKGIRIKTDGKGTGGYTYGSKLIKITKEQYDSIK